MCDVWIQRLKSPEYGQSHIAECLANEKSKEDREHLVEQLESFSRSYPGGLKGYIDKAKQLLKDSLEGVNAYAECTPDVVKGENAAVGSKEYMELEAAGQQQLPYAAFVLVAGGLGERLGYSGIKLGLPIETITSRTYLEHYIQYILEYQKMAKAVRGPSATIPLVIMTSDDTHDRTKQLLETNHYFGIDKELVTLLKQEKVPALVDNEGHIAMSTSPLRIQTKPHGHGDVHSLLATAGLLDKWEAAGLRWVCFFQDTNGLIFNAWPSAIGISLKKNFFMNILASPRKPGEQSGSVVRLRKQDGTEMTINVEYNQLQALLKQSKFAGDVADSEGYSPFPGNMNVFVVGLKRYREVLRGTGGSVPEFVNPKYKDPSKTSFKAPTRLECLMQDLAKSAGPSDQVGVTMVERWFAYSPVKNNVVAAAAKVADGIHPECAFSGEADYFASSLRKLQIAAAMQGATLITPPPTKVTFAAVTYCMGPSIIMLPSFAISIEDCRKRIAKGSRISVTGRSSLVLDGKVLIENLDVDGSFTVTGAKESTDKTVPLIKHKETNEGVSYEAVDQDDPKIAEEIKIRGYKVASLCKGA